MSRLLFITSNRIGDAVLSTGVLEYARESLGRPEVTVVCGALPQPLFRAVPGLERILVMTKAHGRWRNVWAALRGQRFDLAVDLRGSLVTLGLNARKRIVHRKSRLVRHKVEELGALVGVSPPPAPKLHVDDQARGDVAARLGPSTPALLLGPGANFIGKRWPPERFSALATRLVGAAGPLRGLPVALLGGPEDVEPADEIVAALAAKGIAATNVAGALDLLGVAAAMERAALFIGNDSGLMHIAAAAGAPTIGLFGPSDERIYGPWGVRNRAVRGPKSWEEVQGGRYMPLIQESLMLDLTVDKVEATATEILGLGGLAA